MVVVLPAPFGPRMPVTAPGAALSVSPSTAVVWPYRLTSPPISTAGTCGTVLTDASLRRQEPAQRGGVDDLRPPRENPAQQDIAGLLVGILGAVGQDVETVVAVGRLDERRQHHAARTDPGQDEGVDATIAQLAVQIGGRHGAYPGLAHHDVAGLRAQRVVDGGRRILVVHHAVLRGPGAGARSIMRTPLVGALAMLPRTRQRDADTSC